MAKIKKEDVAKALESLKRLGGKMKAVAKVIEEDAIYGSQIGKLKIKNFALERDRVNKLSDIGKIAYKLYNAKKIKDDTLSKLCKQLADIEKTIKQQSTEITKIKKKFKKV